MRKIALGRSGMEVSRLGFGCMGLAEFYGAPASQEQVDEVLTAALEAGITHFDTADMYGRGLNEEQISGFVNAHRKEIVLATKFGAVRTDNPADRVIDNSPDYVKRACETSLKRLGVEVIDLYYMHRRNTDTPIEESVGAMAELVREGKVRHIGLSEMNADTLRRAHAVHPITALQSEFSLSTQDVAGEMLPVCRELGVTYVAYSPLGRGLLSGTYTPDTEMEDSDFRKYLPRFDKDRLAENLKPVDVLKDIAAAHEASPAQIALAWVLAQGDDILPIPGTTKPERVWANAGAADLTLSKDDLDRLAQAFEGAITGDRYPPMGMESVGL